MRNTYGLPRIDRKGERVAALLYKKKGFRILRLNYKCRVGEIDVIAQKEGLLVFCEVKTRHNFKFGQPFEAVIARKQARIRMLAEIFIKNKAVDFVDVRFDVASVIAGEKYKIELIENAF